MRYRTELVGTRDLSPTVRNLTLRVQGTRAFSFRAGQYVDLFVPTQNGLVFKRPYSIASTPARGAEATSNIDIAVTRVEGATSAALHALPVGAHVDLEGPRGSFVRHHTDEPAIFVATGTGLAPLRAMIGEELGRARESGPALALLFGCRTEADLLWREELEAWRREHARFRLEVTLSRADASWLGRRGYVQAHLAELHDDVQAAAHVPPRVYVCGLSQMVLDVVDVLERHVGVARERIHYETYD